MGAAVPLERIARAIQDHIERVVGDTSISITDVAYDARGATAGSLFCAIPGQVTDGHLYIDDALRGGAAALLVERPSHAEVPQIVVSNARRAMALAAAEFFGHPADGLTLLGVTGTNGKTTTAYLLATILERAGHTTGLIGTVETRIAHKVTPGVRTTPESVDLQRLLAEMRDGSVTAVAMEVTSHGLVLERVEGITFAAAGFTNLSQDHLDFHSSMDDYFAAKSSLFDPARTRAGAINIDDPYGEKLIANASVPCISFGVSTEADVRATDVELGPTSTSFALETPRGSAPVRNRLVGHFNVTNCLAAAAVALQAEIAFDAIVAGLNDVPSVPGRFESIDRGQPFTVVVDYAHTPDSLDNVLAAARPLADLHGGRVLVAFGCGGDRDRAKRPLMGAAAARRADIVVVTSDNPRSEEPGAIIAEIIEGVIAVRASGPDHVDADRRAAIAWLLGMARAGDIVVIAGKGHETGQTFADKTIPFDDRIVAGEILRDLDASRG
ncbi:MAG TPA: UDP-N-acetylmuramoyl-L-alanyl-D-glutamate--2,6-diaminopimelate ligase [Actinomycetota bacterium]|nr:UDP-N-acetylmuramoyl-L-alanyl-D-glutamate--2,6-diaminopimelate ligase [Actinomycetota bacterium]